MSTKQHLVCQHIENISRDALEKYQAIIQRYVRRRTGVYALYRRNKLYYVGLAGNLRSRLKSHLRDRHRDSWDRFSVYLTIGDTHLKELETLILRIVKPVGNQQKGKFPRSEDMRRRLSSDIKGQQKKEWQALMGKSFKEKVEKRKSLEIGKVAVLADLIEGPIKLRSRYKGKLVKASVRRDGKIRFKSKLFTSPSLAGAAACNRRSCNGWTFWQFERARGEWVSLDELRK